MEHLPMSILNCNLRYLMKGKHRQKYQYFEPTAEVYTAYSVGKMSLAHFPYVNQDYKAS